MQTAATKTQAVVVRQRPASAAVIEKLMDEGLEPLVARVLAARGIEQRSMAIPSLAVLPHPKQLPGIIPLSTRLAEICESREPLCIVGDYDVDGITATAIAYRCLQTLGAAVHWTIPPRADGYGFSEKIAEQQVEAGSKHLLLVDNGVTAHAGVAAAKARGLQVYIIDHHQPDSTPSAADYAVNPQVDNGGEPLFNAYVAATLVFYVMKELFRIQPAWQVPGDHPDDFLDLVALATLADCADLNPVNRALTSSGLRRIRNGNTRPGIIALMRASNMRSTALSSRDAVFRLIPRLNAAGRIATADTALHCLLAETETEAQQYAQRLDDLNRQRRKLQEKMVQHALPQAAEQAANRGLIVLHDSEWTQNDYAGISGIIAGRLAQQFSCPAIILSRQPDGNWRGSGRAPTGNLIAILSDIAAQHPDIILRSGGHKRAAGVLVSEHGIGQFGDLFAAAYRAAEGHTAPPAIEVDALSAKDITVEAIRQLDGIVWGNAFPAPCFASVFSLRDSRTLPYGISMQLLGEDGSEFPAIYFGDRALPPFPAQLLYRAEINISGKPQLIIEDILASAQSPVSA